MEYIWNYAKITAAHRRNLEMEELVKYMKAMVFLQAQSFIDADDRLRPEILLARAGLGYGEIAEILGKSEAAVAKSVQRAR